ncbi:MAG: SIS domain-containing protein [Actinobacteria bacterium]|nr:SIS domain-containing protein [Actinomycetota bacterium]
MSRVELAGLDSAGMLATVEASPRQWAEAVARARQAPPPPVSADDVRAVVLIGMGGSGIAADVAVVAAAEHGRVPVIPVKGYELPGWVGPDTLVVAVSYSGSTEETLAACDAAGAVGAPRYAVTAGGELARRAASEGFPTVSVPAGGQPRANMPSLTVAVLAGLEAAGLLDGMVDQLASVPDHLVACLDRWAAADPVDDLAAALDGLIPVFYGARGWPAVVALRAKCQVNENAKRPAFCHELPERDHNEIVGWGANSDAGARFAIVDVRSPADEHPQVRRRFSIIRRSLSDRVGTHLTIQMEGDSSVTRFAAGVLLVDLLSVRLAYLGREDPTPVRAIEALKRRLAEPSP